MVARAATACRAEMVALILLLIVRLFEDRFYGWLNSYLDSQRGPLVEGAQGVLVWLATNPLGASGLVFLVVVLVLLVHAHVESRGQQLAAPGASAMPMLLQIAEEDREHLGERVVIVEKSADFGQLAVPNPYIDFTFMVFNGSVFQVFLDDAVQGHASCIGQSLKDVLELNRAPWPSTHSAWVYYPRETAAVALVDSGGVYTDPTPSGLYGRLRLRLGKVGLREDGR